MDYRFAVFSFIAIGIMLFEYSSFLAFDQKLVSSMDALLYLVSKFFGLLFVSSGVGYAYCQVRQRNPHLADLDAQDWAVIIFTIVLSVVIEAVAIKFAIVLYLFGVLLPALTYFLLKHHYVNAKDLAVLIFTILFVIIFDAVFLKLDLIIYVFAVFMTVLAYFLVKNYVVVRDRKRSEGNKCGYAI